MLVLIQHHLMVPTNCLSGDSRPQVLVGKRGRAHYSPGPRRSQFLLITVMHRDKSNKISIVKLKNSKWFPCCFRKAFHKVLQMIVKTLP